MEHHLANGANDQRRRDSLAAPADLSCDLRPQLLTSAAFVRRRQTLVDHSQRLSPHARLFAAAAGLALVALVAPAATLTPDPRGWGTHEQLGMAPCWFRQATGRPCPMCGMTTAWAYAVRGNALAAVDANLGGTLLVVACAGGAAWSLAAATAGRLLGGRLRLQTAAWVATAWLIVTLADWARRWVQG